jgi:hypothetical protein
MRYIYILLLLTVALIGCNSDTSSKVQEEIEKKEKAVIIYHYNITFAADLSNRLNTKFYPKAVADTSIVNMVIDNIYPRILKNKRSMNQLDQFRIDFINKKQINAYDVKTNNLEINFKRFGNKQSERISYLRTDFNKRAAAFKNEYKRINEQAVLQPYGSDIWTYLNEGITNNVIDTAKSYTSFEDYYFLNQQKNVLILLTDGYLEAGIYNQNFDLSGSKIKNFRETFLKSGESDLNKFYNQHSEYKIKAINNPLLKDLNVLVLEMYDRTESNQGATIHPTDMEIMRIFWKDWLIRSGVKKVELHPKFSNKAEAEKVIMKFIGV